MTRNEIESELYKILREICGSEKKIYGHYKIYEDLELDSVGLLTLATQVENKFKIYLPAEESEIPKTVNEFISFIEREIPQQGNLNNSRGPA